jgi:hypothetical protein
MAKARKWRKRQLAIWRGENILAKLEEKPYRKRRRNEEKCESQ